MSHNINIFISHSWSYTEHYDKLCKWIFEEPWSVSKIPIRFENLSIPRDDPIHNANNDKELQQKIYKEINMSHVIVIPTGMYSNYSNWIKKEIDGSKKYNRPILAVNPWAQERRSSVVLENAAANVGWNKEPLVKEIWNLYKKHYNVQHN